jgi:hypothetical protein
MAVVVSEMRTLGRVLVLTVSTAWSGLILPLPGADADAAPGVPAGVDSVSVVADSTLAAVAGTEVAGTDRVRPLEHRARVPRDRPPWMRLTAPRDTLMLSRNEVERAGAHQPIELLSRVPGTHALEGSGTVPLGGLTLGGSFATPEVSADGWALRLPRLEGLDLSRLALDRLGPGLEMVSPTSPGSFAVTDLAAGGAGASDLRLEPAEPVSDSSRSRVAAYQAGFGWDGGGILFSDSRGRWSYGFGVDNADAGRSGGVDQTSTRVAMIDLARGTWWGRLAASLRGTEAYYLWKNGNRMKHDDQGVHLTAVIGDSLGPAWSLRVGVLDDRLSGSEFPDVEFRRKRLEVEARWWERPTVPVWGRVVAERDWFAVRFTGGEFAPRVNRSRAEAGTRLALGATRLHLVGTLSTSGSHPLRAGAQAELEVDLAGDTKLGIGGGRAHRLPTLDQDVLAWGQPVAEPERHDAFSVRLNREGRLSSPAPRSPAAGDCGT